MGFIPWLARKCLHVVKVAPFFVGTLIREIPLGGRFFGEYVSRYVYFLAVFVSWHLFMLAVSRVYAYGPKLKRRAAFGQMVFLMLSAGLVVLSLEGFRSTFPQEMFLLALLGVAGRGICRLFEQRRRPGWALAGGLVYLISCSFLSLLIVDFAWQWQSLVVSLSVAAVFAPLVIAGIRQTLAITNQEKDQRWLDKLDALVPVLGIVLVLGLCYLGYLHRNYLLMLLVLVAHIHLKIGFSGTRTSWLEPAQLRLRSEAICAMYVGVLIVLALFQGPLGVR